LSAVGGVETSEEQKRRFEVECEFVQALSNPHYLNFLAQRGYFKEAYFINYLKYLLYWKRPEYARALKYPQCLHFLEAIQHSEFREAIACNANAKFIEEQQILQWQYYTRKRQRLHVIGGCCIIVVVFSIVTKLTIELIEPLKMNALDRKIQFIEILEELCNHMLEYKLHKDKEGLQRFSKEETSTMNTLNKLHQRGVKVELGIPHEMWDKPGVEITSLKQQCENILGDYDEDIERWFYSGRSRIPLQKYLCEQRVLKGNDVSCIRKVNSEL
uniref:Mediator of RNA polymerase II transcription subunit 31 n=1 Tax=Anisakis simplex TaxID=6269 RepID=A0A158PNJ4_ANISI